jgi:hypothetical protein
VARGGSLGWVGGSEARGKGRLKKEGARYLSIVPTYLPFFGDFWRFSGLSFENMFMVFWGSSCRKTTKNAIKKIEGEIRQEKSFFSQLFRPKVFDMDFPQKVFNSVFELPLLRNAQNAMKN